MKPLHMISLSLLVLTLIAAMFREFLKEPALTPQTAIPHQLMPPQVTGPEEALETPAGSELEVTATDARIGLSQRSRTTADSTVTTIHNEEPVIAQEQQAVEILGRLESLIEQCDQRLKANADSGETVPLPASIETLQQVFNELQQLAAASPDSAVVQETLGEAAYQFATFRNTTSLRREAKPDAASAIKTIPERKLRDIAMTAFESAVAIDPTLAVAHDRIAKPRLAKLRSLTDSTMLEHLIQSVVHDAGSSRSIGQLVKVLSETDVLSEPEKYREIEEALKRVHGEARVELRLQLSRVRERLQQARADIQESDQNGKATPNAAVEAIDLQIAQLESVKTQFRDRRASAFGGLFDEVDRQAEASGKHAARQAIDTDIATLMHRRKVLVDAAENAETSSRRSKERKLARVERAVSLIKAVIDGTRE